MLLWVLNIFYVLIAIAMIALILMQRGAGAQAGSGFGGGASGTVFGARGASNFLSKSTKWLAVAFFGLTLAMAWLHLQGVRSANEQRADLGVMAGQQQVPAAGNQPAPTVPTVPAIPQATPTQAAPAQTVTTPAPAASEDAQKPAQGN
ncbi:MAG: preprotein translocase subunit SecG [Xanthomonadaceae bacterium]|nr:preprotein translocase subunit SecG [Xanthomonadaceae bacterium]